MSARVFKTYFDKSKNIFTFRKYQRHSRRTLLTSQVQPNIVVSDTNDVDIPNVTISEYLFPKLEKYEKFTATTCATTGRGYTFGQLRSKSKNLSKALRHIFKLKKGDVVAVFSVNKPEYAIILLGLLDAGLPITTLNPVYTPGEISKQLLNCSVKLIITQPQLIGTMKSGLKLMKQNLPIVAIKSEQSESLPAGIIDFEELVNLDVDVPDAELTTSDLALLPYSSGTTGLPKGVELTHANIVANMCQMTHEEYNYFTEPSESFQDILPGVLPSFHLYGLILNILSTLYYGAKNVTLEKFTPELYISALKNNPISIIYAAPPLVLFLISNPNVKSEHFKHLKMIMSAAAPLGYLDEQRMLNKIGHQKAKIIQGYGLTETSPVLTFFPKNIEKTERNGGSSGKPLPNTFLKIIAVDDETGTPLGPMKKGELLARGPQIMKGYYKKEEETKNAFLDGWFRTGDIGYYDEKGLVYITDRLKELIKVKGFQVAPAELEELIRDHPSVEDVAVIGIPHDKWGEVPRAYVVPKKTASVSDEEIKNHVAKNVAKFKELAGGVKIVDTIPRNPSGKLLRRQLKLNFLEKGY